MINCIKMSLKIDRTYSINSFIYMLRKLPVLKDLLTDDIYKSESIKKYIRLLMYLYAAGELIVFKFIYFYIIYALAGWLNNDTWSSFVHVYFWFTIIGMFINNNTLGISTKKYFSIILFGMDAKTFMWSSIFYDIGRSLLLNSVFLGMFTYVLKGDFLIALLLVLIGAFARMVGEAINMWYYKKYNYVWISNIRLYLIVLGVLLVCALVPYFDIIINNYIIFGTLCGLIILSIFAIRYLRKIDDYKAIFKILNTESRVMSSEQEKSYFRQAMVEVKNKDKLIDNKKLVNKKGYDLFNTIFFERHKEILVRSVKNYSLVLTAIYIGCIFVIFKNSDFSGMVHNFLLNNLAWFVLIMYFINRGAIVTQAMFFNCDHAMLTYNFYREPKVILGLFKKRLMTVVSINLIPVFVIGIGNIILLYLTGGSSLITYITSFIFIFSLSVFFSVHHLVCYYLLQPYDKKLQIKKFSYSLVYFITYIFCFTIFDLVMSSLVFSILGIIFTIIYILLSLLLVYKFAPRTFRIN